MLKSAFFRKGISLIPNVIVLAWKDAHEYVTRLFMRAWWARQGLAMAPSVRLHYQSAKQIKIFGKSWIGNYSVVLVIDPKESGRVLLTLGNNIYIGDQANLRAAGGSITIGNDVLIADHVTLVSSNHGMKMGKLISAQDWENGDIMIENDVWIGAGVTILPGATIRRGAVIAAGAVVRGEVPECAIYGGVPARIISMRS